MIGFLRGIRSAFVNPTTKQKEAYGRFAHNLSAACLIAASSIIFTENRYGAFHVTALVAFGVACFIGGAVLSKGE